MYEILDHDTHNEYPTHVAYVNEMSLTEVRTLFPPPRFTVKTVTVLSPDTAFALAAKLRLPERQTAGAT